MKTRNTNKLYLWMKKYMKTHKTSVFENEIMSREKEKIDASKRFAQSLYASDMETLNRDDLAFIFQMGAKWSDAHTASPWVSVKESLPKEDPERNDYMSVEVLTITDKGYIKLDTYDHQNQVWFIHSEILFDEDDSLGKVTHWMYIPKLPANENV